MQGDGFLLTGIDGGKCVCDQLDGCGFDCGAAETQFDFTLHAVHAAAFSGAGLDVTADDLCVYTATIGVVDLRHVYDLAVRHGELHLFHAVCTVLLLPGVEELHRRLALCHQFPGENGMLLMSQPDAAADNAANGRLGCTEFHILVEQDVLDGTAFLCGVFHRDFPQLYVHPENILDDLLPTVAGDVDCNRNSATHFQPPWADCPAVGIRRSGTQGDDG